MILPSGVSVLDRLLNGGLSTGRFTHVYGEAASGKTTIALQFVSAACRIGVGTVYVNSVQDSRLIYGELEIGEPIATGVINAVKMHAQPEILNIIDAPPGTACPVIETMRNSDYILLVTEPTPFGLHDLSMTVGVVKELGIPCGVIINRAGIGNDAVKRYCESENIPILLEIPFERRIAELYSQGIPFVTEMPHWRNRFLDVLREIEEVVRHGD